MKKRMICLLLSGCAKAAPEQTADGADWDENRTTLGGVLGVEEPGHESWAYILPFYVVE